MKEETKKNNQQHIYRVRAYRDFDYPSFSINKVNKLEDISYKALDEMKENSDTPNYFNFEIINVLPFSLRVSVEDTTENMDYDFFIREISLAATREKYGELNYETNPKIFEKEGETDLSVAFHILEEVENYYVNQVKKYTELIRNKKIPRAPYFGPPAQHQSLSLSTSNLTEKQSSNKSAKLYNHKL